jgi:hypothetical protein
MVMEGEKGSYVLALLQVGLAMEMGVKWCIWDHSPRNSYKMAHEYHNSSFYVAQGIIISA